MLDMLLPICYGELGLNSEQIGNMSIYEIINMYHGYIVRKRNSENMLAQFVTLWIANTAGKSLQKELTLKKLFKDGRFDKIFDEDETREILQGLEVKE